jgi:hypothetical protein
MSHVRNEQKNKGSMTGGYSSRASKEEQNLKNGTYDTSADHDKYIEEAVQEALKLWKDVKTMSETEEFMKWNDSQKIKHFREKMGYENFMNDQPVVSNYMICMRCFSVKAFRRYLMKCKMTKHTRESMQQKGYMEDQWARRQADYMRFLWEASQKGHFNHTIAQMKWQEAYEQFKGEMDDFRDKHDKIKKTVDDEKKVHKVEVINEMVDRLRNSNQKLSEDDTRKLIEIIKTAKIKASTVENTKEEVDPNTGIKTIYHPPQQIDNTSTVLTQEIADNM